jgi:hypothetical protein
LSTPSSILQEGIASLKGDAHQTFVNTMTIYTFVVYFVGMGNHCWKAKLMLGRRYGQRSPERSSSWDLKAAIGYKSPEVPQNETTQQWTHVSI